LVHGAFHVVPGKRGPDGQWIEDTRFINATKKQINAVAARGGKILFLETSKEDIAYFDELMKIANLDWKGKYQPPRELPRELRELLTAARETLFQGPLMSATRARNYIRKTFLSDGGRYFMDVVNHAREKGFRVIPVVPHKFLQQELDLQEIGRRLKSQGKHREALPYLLGAHMQGVELEHFMKREIEKKIQKGVVPDIVICGGSHSGEVEKLLAEKGITPKRKDMPLSMYPKREQEPFKRIKPLYPHLRELYAEERKRELQSIARALRTVKEKKAKTKKNRKRTPKRTRGK